MQTLFLRIPVVSLADSLNHRLRALIPSGSLTRTFAEVSSGMQTLFLRIPVVSLVPPWRDSTGYGL
jgi:hypothetical protein